MSDEKLIDEMLTLLKLIEKNYRHEIPGLVLGQVRAVIAKAEAPEKREAS